MEAHPGAMKAQPGAMEAHPGAVRAHSGAVEAHPGAMELTELWSLPLETWRLPSCFKTPVKKSGSRNIVTKKKQLLDLFFKLENIKQYTPCILRTFDHIYLW
jgi:hypothetical protein